MRATFGLVVNAGNVISSLCHTVLRLEPYTPCAFKCVYCYSKWYGVIFDGEPQPLMETFNLFRSFARKVRRMGLKPIPFRLSTLVDPFPLQEQHHKIVEKILAEALSHEYPLIINTESVLYAQEPTLRKLIENLVDKGLAILQVSISTLKAEDAKKIEPHAPPPTERLRAASSLGGDSIVLRLSPFIPCLSPTYPSEIEEFAATLREYGVKHVIVESLRMEKNRIEWFLSSLGIKADIEAYSVKDDAVARISTSTRENVYSILSKTLNKHGIGFATCKEGLFAYHTTPDCCGAYLLKDYAIRPTLYDIYKHITEKGPTQPEDILKGLESNPTRVCGEKLKQYPRQVSKPLKYHEKRILKTIQNKDLLNHIAPHLAYEKFGGSVEVRGVGFEH